MPLTKEAVEGLLDWLVSRRKMTEGLPAETESERLLISTVVGAVTGIERKIRRTLLDEEGDGANPNSN